MQSAGEIALLGLFCVGLFLLVFLTGLLILRIVCMQRVPQTEKWVLMPMQDRGTHHRHVTRSSQTSSDRILPSHESVWFL